MPLAARATRADGDTVEILAAVQRNFIRPRGEDLRKGELAIESGRRLGAADLGMLASLNPSMIDVCRVPRVAIVATGDELVDVDQVPAGAQIVNSSAYALAGAGIVIPEDRAAQITPAVVKASAGAAEHAVIARVKNLRMACQELKKNGFWVIGLEAQGPVPLAEVPGYDKIALLLGGEDSGVRYGLEKEADIMAYIPMRGSFNSLNVSQSATIALYELIVRRGTGR